MNCPKCGFENPEGRGDCLRCHVIFSKIRPIASTEDSITVEVDTENSRCTLAELLFSGTESAGGGIMPGKIILLLVLALWGGKLIFSGIDGNAAGESWLHLINLPFHEAGHIFFRPFGRFITSLGGTLGQLLVPLICMGVLLLKTRDPFGAAVCFWWFGENFLDIAPYVNDARAGQLPLVGGNFGQSSPYGFHDWEFLLTESGLLRYDHALARLAHWGGALLMVLALAWCVVLIRATYKGLQVNA